MKDIFNYKEIKYGSRKPVLFLVTDFKNDNILLFDLKKPQIYILSNLYYNDYLWNWFDYFFKYKLAPIHDKYYDKNRKIRIFPCSEKEMKKILKEYYID